VDFKLYLHISSKVILAVIILFSGVFIIQLVNLTYAQDFASLFYTPTDTPYGIPYGQWIVKYWDWWDNVPAAESPSEHTDKYQCFMHDVGNVTFLVDPLKMNTEKTYSCKIASNKAIFFSLVTSEYDTGIDGFEHATDKELVDSAKQDDNSNAFKLTIDGKVIPAEFIRNLRAESPFWNVTIAEGNHYDSKPGTFRAFAEGFYIFLKPLPPGSHQISYEASSPKSDLQVSPGGKITYNFMVNSTST
jgi:hypothetical protein